MPAHIERSATVSGAAKGRVRALSTPEVKGRLAAEGPEVIGSMHEQAMAAFQRVIGNGRK
jgi:hypothetical protein